MRPLCDRQPAGVRTLFISYDGLLDPLGGSQILPYLYGIASHPRALHILSFEKPDRFSKGARALKYELEQHGIMWTPLSFSKKFGRAGKVWDLVRMYLFALILQIQNRFEIIHCRSYQAMQVGCFLSRLFRVKTIFDMRGLWVDERIDGGIWSSYRLPDQIIFWLYKKIEVRLLACATHVIVLTERVLPELRKLSPNMIGQCSVIPCCADFDHFNMISATEKINIRSQLGLPSEALVISYSGSLGTWYMLDEMLSFFSKIVLQHTDAHFLLITRDWRPEHDELLVRMGLSTLRSRIHIKSASREEVPQLLATSDIMISFIKPAYSKMASSPTKLAEAFAVGIPVISNTGIGDVDEITRNLQAGEIVDLNSEESVRGVIAQIESLITLGGSELRTRARARFGLEVAAKNYLQVYQILEKSVG